MKEIIEKAIFRLKQSKQLGEPTNFTHYEYEVTLNCLQSELNCQENKPLELSELKEMFCTNY